MASVLRWPVASGTVALAGDCYHTAQEPGRSIVKLPGASVDKQTVYLTINSCQTVQPKYDRCVASF